MISEGVSGDDYITEDEWVEGGGFRNIPHDMQTGDSVGLH